VISSQNRAAIGSLLLRGDALFGIAAIGRA